MHASCPSTLARGAPTHVDTDTPPHTHHTTPHPPVQVMVEDIFEQTLKVMKVPGVRAIGFKHLTFGDAPFRVNSMTVSDKHGVDVSGGEG